MKSDWKKVSEYLKLALGFVVPMDSTQTAFYFMKLSELIDVAISFEPEELPKPEQESDASRVVKMNFAKSKPGL